MYFLTVKLFNRHYSFIFGVYVIFYNIKLPYRELMENQISKLWIYEMLNFQPVATTNSQAFPSQCRKSKFPNFKIPRFKALELRDFEPFESSNYFISPSKILQRWRLKRVTGSLYVFSQLLVCAKALRGRGKFVSRSHSSCYQTDNSLTTMHRDLSFHYILPLPLSFKYR